MLFWLVGKWSTVLPGGMEHILIPTVICGMGLLFFALALPLWLKLVPINPVYGVRLPSTMASEERWFAVNAVFGKHLFGWSLLVIGAGIAGFFQLPRHQDAYPWAAITLALVAIAASVVATLWWMHQHPVDAPARKRNRLASWGGQALVAVVIAMFIRSFIAGAYRMPNGAEPGVAKGSHWLASHLNTGFATGDLVAYESDNGQPWLARVEAVEAKGLVLKRGGQKDSFFVKWDKVIGKLLFSHFTPGDTAGRPDTTAGNAARFVHVICGVKNPRSVLWKEGMTVLHAVRDTGGFTSFAHPSQTKVVRGDKASRVNLQDQTEPFMLEPDDQIIIPE
jgi:hypothetical protein